jgi:pimeloyl-ACP methyl ester carboxylesterase
MGYVAQKLGETHSVFEPMQHADSVQGQVDELHAVITENSNEPVILIGWSWGAWLGWWYAAQHPQQVKRLILVSSGPFESFYAEGMDETRLSRLTPAEQIEVKTLQAQFTDSTIEDKTFLFARFGALFGKADSYDPIAIVAPPTELQMEIFNAVWPEGAALRKDGRLLADAGKITLPVVAIHGDYDPHPWQGVKEPLSKRLMDFTFHLLPNCGHDPWQEREAQVPFFDLLESYL